MFLRPSVDDLCQIYDAFIGDHRSALRDAPGLDAALAQPWQSAGGEDAYPSLHLKAAVLYAGVDNRQAFVDGNKRIAFFALRLFYEFAGYVFSPPEDEMYELAMYVANTRPVDRQFVANRLEEWVQPIGDVPEY